MTRLYIATGLLTALAGLCLRAQSMDLRANIPFEFRVGDAVMPAGEYTVHHANRTLVLRNTVSPRIARILFTTGAYRVRPRPIAALEFKHYGETYFLSEVWTSNSPEGAALPRTRLEKELALRSGGNVERAAIPLRPK